MVSFTVIDGSAMSRSKSSAGSRPKAGSTSLFGRALARSDPFAAWVAASHAAAGEYGRAMASANKAIELAESSADHDYADRIRKRLMLYQRSMPYREPVA